MLFSDPLIAPVIPGYIVAKMGTDVKELLFGEKRNDLQRVALVSEVGFVHPTNKSIEIDKPILSSDGSDKKLTKAYLEDKLATFRIDLRHEAKKAQIIHVQAVKSLPDFYDKGAWQVKGSPFLYPASRCPSIQ